MDQIRLDRVSPERIQAVLTARVAAARGNPVTEQRARVSAASTLRQARSLFSPRLRLPFENLPNPFEGVRVKAAGTRPYASTINAEMLLVRAKAELAGTDPEACKAFLLALGAGLRKAEIDALQWQQIDAHKGVIRVTTTDAFSPKTAASEGEVFVDPGLIAELDPFRQAAKGLFVLEGRNQPPRRLSYQNYRAEHTFVRLCAWLRRQGLLGPKPLHQLRKEFGSLIAASGDIHVASRQLRHSSIAITAAFHADHRRRVAPPVGEILRSGAVEGPPREEPVEEVS